MQVSMHVQDIIMEAVQYANLEHKPDVCSHFSNDSIEAFEAGLDKNLFNVFNQVRERRDCPPEPCNRFCNVAPMRVSARTPCPRPTRRRAATTN